MSAIVQLGFWKIFLFLLKAGLALLFAVAIICIVFWFLCLGLVTLFAVLQNWLNKGG